MIAADSNVIIRFVEGDPKTRDPIERRFAVHRSENAFLALSILIRLECRTKPVRDRDGPLLAVWDGFFATPEIVWTGIGSAEIETATELRAKYKFNTPDALHLAGAIVSRATHFLTGDKALLRCREIAVEHL